MREDKLTPDTRLYSGFTVAQEYAMWRLQMAALRAMDYGIPKLPGERRVCQNMSQTERIGERTP